MSASLSVQHVDRLAIEPAGERRRRQLVRVAAHIIEQEGVDSLRMPRVAEVAGCTRSLVYRYFPRRENLFFAVISEFYEALEERISPDVQMAKIRSLGDASSVLSLLEAIWDVTEETGTAGLILYASPRLGAELGAQLDPENRRFEARWVGPLRGAGLGEIEATLVVKSAVALFATLIDRCHCGDIDRNSAIRMGQRGLAGMIRGFADGQTRDATEDK